MTNHPKIPARGLALTETMMAVAVIVILLSILLPALAKMKDPSRRAMCAENMHKLMVGVQSYASDHQGKGPIRGYFSYDIAETSHEAYGWGGSNIKVFVNLAQLYKKYIGGQSDMLYCPSTYATFRDNASYGWKTAFNPTAMYTPGSYNYALVFAPRSTAVPDFVGPEPYPQAKWDSRFVTWINGTWQPRNPSKTFQMPSSPALATDGYVGGFLLAHKPGVNVMYMDGHVRYHDIGGDGFSNAQGFDVWYKVSLKQ